MQDTIRHLLLEIFNHDFSGSPDAEEFRRRFFAKTLSWNDLKTISAMVQGSQILLDGQVIPAAVAIPGKEAQSPFMIVAQLHGNEPAGLAGIVFAMALSQAGFLERDVIAMIGNPLAAGQYFEAWAANPNARQETRDAYRCGLDKNGNLYPDMNRIPVDFPTQDTSKHNIKRAQELYAVGLKSWGVLDIHSARGDMFCITDFRDVKHLKHSPIRRVLTNLAEAISAQASTTVTVKTLKTILATLPNIENQTGIEAGSHEDPKAPESAASFTLSLLYTLGLTKVPPLFDQENGVFERYNVRPRLTYADLVQEGTLQPNDRVYMSKDGKDYQYEEMEAVKKGQVLAIARPSGTLFKAPYDFSGIFPSKAAALYDKDPSVGPWPVAVDKLASTKFCYPCDVSEWKVSF